MVAVYPAEGARYARHCDNPDRNGRKMTVILYLNPGWEQRMGGNLHIFRSANAASEVRSGSGLGSGLGSGPG